MATVALGSVRSCGVTTTALALAALWRADRPVLVAEVDPAGGSLAARLGLAPDPGLVSLAAAARRGLDPKVLDGHTQGLDSTRRVLVGAPSAAQARNALGYLPGIPAAFEGFDGVILADCGRLDAGAPVATVFEEAVMSLLCVRGELADLQALSAWLDQEPRTAGLALLLVGESAYAPGEITDTLGVDVAGAIPWDPAATARLDGRPPRGAAARSPLARQVRDLTERLFEALDAPEVGSSAAEPVSNVAPESRAGFVPEPAR